MKLPSLYLNFSPWSFAIGREVAFGEANWTAGFHVFRVNHRALFRLYGSWIADGREVDYGDNFIAAEILFVFRLNKASGAKWEFEIDIPDFADWWGDRG